MLPPSLLWWYINPLVHWESALHPAWRWTWCQRHTILVWRWWLFFHVSIRRECAGLVHIHFLPDGCTIGYFQYYRLVSISECLYEFWYKSICHVASSPSPVVWLTTVPTCNFSITLGFLNRNTWFQIIKTGHLVWTLCCWISFWWLPVLQTV